MKKSLLILFVFVMITLPSFAVITDEETASDAYIQNHGHSDEMSRLIDLQNAQINGVNSTYRSKDPAYYADKKINFIRRVFMYFDCGLDDGKFGKHSINFTPRYDDL